MSVHQLKVPRASEATFHGHIDVVRGSEIVGWARCKIAAAPVLLDVLLNGRVVATIVANQLRGDLKSADLGDGCHGFAFTVPDRFCDGIAHRLDVRVADSTFMLPRARAIGDTVVFSGLSDHMRALSVVPLKNAEVDWAPRAFGPAGASDPAFVSLAAEKQAAIPAPLNFETVTAKESVRRRFASIDGFTFPALTCHALRNAVLMKGGAVVVNGHEVLEESMEGKLGDNGFTKTGQGDFIIDPRASEERIAGPVATIHKRGVFNYSLWLSEMLTRAHILAQIPDLDDVPVVLNTTPSMSAKAVDVRFRTLEYLGIKRSRVIVSNADSLRCDLLYFPRANSRYRNQRIAQNFDDMTQLLRNRIVGPADIKPLDLLYVSRGDARERRIVNEAELIKALEKLGFKSITGGALTFEDQVRQFAQARIIFGAHGAGLANMAFAPRGTPVVELFPETVVGRWMYRVMAHAKSHPYFAGVSEAELCRKTDREDFIVDIDRCVRLAERALKYAKI